MLLARSSSFELLMLVFERTMFNATLADDSFLNTLLITNFIFSESYHSDIYVNHEE